MNITLVGINYAPEPTGIAVYTSGVAAGLHARGHDVKVITGFPHYPGWRLQAGYSGLRMSESIDGVSVDRVRHTVPRKPTAFGRVLMEITFAISVLLTRRGRPDLYICVSPSLFSAAAISLSSRLHRRRVPVAVWVQDIYSAGVVETKSFGSWLAKATAIIEGFVLRGASYVVVIHDRFGTYIQRELRVHPEKIICIRNWTHTEPASRNVDRDSIRARLNWQTNEIVVLHAGNMGAKQHLGNVIRAAAESSDLGSRIRFVLLGDGNQRLQLEEMAEGVRNIEFIRPVESAEFAELLNAADVLLVNEGVGVIEMAVPSKLTTYFAAGKPVVAATEASSVTASEIIASGGGVIVEPGSPSALISAIEELVLDQSRCVQLAKSGMLFSDDLLKSSTALEKFEALAASAASARDSVVARS